MSTIHITILAGVFNSKKCQAWSLSKATWVQERALFSLTSMSASSRNQWMSGLTLLVATSYNDTTPTLKDGLSPSNSMPSILAPNCGTRLSRKSQTSDISQSVLLWQIDTSLERSWAAKAIWTLLSSISTAAYVIHLWWTALSRRLFTWNVIRLSATSESRREIGRERKAFLWIICRRCMIGMRNGSAGRRMWRSWLLTPELMMSRILRNLGNCLQPFKGLSKLFDPSILFFWERSAIVNYLVS